MSYDGYLAIAGVYDKLNKEIDYSKWASFFEACFEKYGKYVIKLEAPVIEVSSSMVREKLRQGEDISGFIDPKVLNYINEKGLYK